jgi:magnesium-transporting ATPase (P-type)
MFRTVVIGVFATVVVLIATDLARRILCRNIKRPAHKADRGNLIVWLIQICVNVAGIACLAAVAVTGFAPVLANKPAISGYLLMAHVTTAGAFAVSAVFVAILWLSRSGFSCDYASNSDVLRKSFFWIAVATAIPTLASAVLAMFPLLPEAQQETLLLIHRVSALLLVTSGALFTYFSFAAWYNYPRS